MRCAMTFGLLLAARAATAAETTPTDGARPLDGVDIIEQLGAQVPPDLVFRDQEGRAVRLGDRFHKGRPIVLVLAWYRCPMLCSMVQRGVARALPAGGAWRLGQDFDALTISFASDEGPRDAEARRRAHLAALGVPPESPEWPFLTGDRAAVDRLTAALGFHYTFDPKTRQYAHAAALFVLTPAGTISRYLYGVEYPSRQLRLALVEAADGRAGPSLDRVLLACFRYDPARRRYGLFLARFLQAGGLAVFVAVAALLAWLWRRESARARAELLWPRRGIS